MSKDLFTSMATGLIAKLVRYGIVAISGTSAISDETWAHVLGFSGAAAAIGWSIWEDRVKARAAQVQVAVPSPILPAGK